MYESLSTLFFSCASLDIFAASNNKEFPQKLVDTRLKDTNGDLVGVCIPYEIDTKYYTAKVDFWLDEIDKATQKETIKAYCEKDTEISKVIDAFVFIFDKNEVGYLLLHKRTLIACPYSHNASHLHSTL